MCVFLLRSNDRTTAAFKWRLTGNQHLDALRTLLHSQPPAIKWLDCTVFSTKKKKKILCIIIIQYSCCGNKHVMWHLGQQDSREVKYKLSVKIKLPTNKDVPPISHKCFGTGTLSNTALYLWIKSNILNSVCTVHDAKFNLSNRLFMHWEANTFSTQSFPTCFRHSWIVERKGTVNQMCLLLSAWNLLDRLSKSNIIS